MFGGTTKSFDSMYSSYHNKAYITFTMLAARTVGTVILWLAMLRVDVCTPTGCVAVCRV